VDGYLGMDKSKMTRLSEADKKYSRKDAKDYRGIKFVASKPLQTKLAGSNFRFPAAVCMASFANPEREDLIWRSTLRSVLGKTDADADIEDYYDENGLTKPWEVSPTRLRLKDDDPKDGCNDLDGVCGGPNGGTVDIGFGGLGRRALPLDGEPSSDTTELF